MGFGKDGKGVIYKEDISQALGALGSGVAIIVATNKAVSLSAFRMLKSEIIAQITGLTAGEEPDGLMLGIAAGDLSVTQIEAAIEMNGPVDRGDTINEELAMRPVWLIGRFNSNDPVTAQFVSLDAVWKKRWTWGETSGWNLFVYNLTAGALTTGSTVRIKASHFGVWVGE